MATADTGQRAAFHGEHDAFFLGTHQVEWLGRTDVPLFVSARRLRLRKRLPTARWPWALDSGFSELSLFGRWETSPQQYADETRRWRDRIGGMQWAAPQDWMCEPFIVAKTGKSVREHQQRTIASYHDLRRLADGVQWIPVLQGWGFEDYYDHAAQWLASGVPLTDGRVVGLGSVCRRQSTGLAADIGRSLFDRGIRLHAFGFKFGGLVACAPWLASADSLAWSYNARRNVPMAGCSHGSCANCLRWALRWRERLLNVLSVHREYVQPVLL